MFKKIIILILLLSFGYAGFYIYENHYFKMSVDENKNELDRFYTVSKKDLIIGIKQFGSINAKKKHKVSLKASTNTKLLWVVEESSTVKKGDTIAKCETSDLEDDIDNNKLDIDTLGKELGIMEEEKKILLSSNKESIRSAKDKVVVSEDAMNKYWKLDGPDSKDNFEFKIDTKKKSYDKAKTTFENYKKSMKSTIYSDEDEKKDAEDKLESYEQSVNQAKLDYDNATSALKVFKKYTHPQKIKSLKNSLEQSKLSLEKTKISVASSVIQKDNTIFSKKKRKEKKIKDLKKKEEYLSQMELKAPVDGIVIYGDVDNRWNRVDVKVGMDVRRGKVLFTIPEMNHLIVNLDIPEQYRSRVNIGSEAIITPTSLTSLKVKGKVSKIATLPKNRIHWDASSPKIYKSELALNKQNSKLVSGMNVEVEIVSKILKDVIAIPIEAIFSEKNKSFVYMKNGLSHKKVFIDTGEANDTHCRIIKGLDIDDIIYLYKPE